MQDLNEIKVLHTGNIDVSFFKKRLTLAETIVFINEVVDSCFKYNKEFDIEEYNPILFDFSVRAAVVRHYSDYADRKRESLVEFFKDKEELEKAVNNIDELYDYCCNNIFLTKDYIENELGIDSEQIFTMISAIDDVVGHRRRLIENSIGAETLIKYINKSSNDFTNGLTELLKSVSKGFEGINGEEILQKTLDKFDLEAMVKAYAKTELKKRNDMEVKKARAERNAKSSNVIPARNYKSNK